VSPPPASIPLISDEATKEARLLSGRDSRTQEFLRVMRISREFIRGFQGLYRAGPCVTFFGSARLGEDTTEYARARAAAASVATQGWTINTGGGPGMMEAANRGAKDVGGKSIGATIDVNVEPANRYCDRHVPFHYFFARKVVLVKYSYGFVLTPGGFGTLDEMFEALTLIQTGRLEQFPVVLFGVDYWQPLVNWVRDTLVPRHTITQADLDRLVLTDDPDDIVAALHPLAVQLDLQPLRHGGKGPSLR
jgi:uncharacterized protein (TIGR00730 family)